MCRMVKFELKFTPYNLYPEFYNNFILIIFKKQQEMGTALTRI